MTVRASQAPNDVSGRRVGRSGFSEGRIRSTTVERANSPTIDYELRKMTRQGSRCWNLALIVHMGNLKLRLLFVVFQNLVVDVVQGAVLNSQSVQGFFEMERKTRPLNLWLDEIVSAARCCHGSANILSKHSQWRRKLTLLSSAKQNLQQYRPKRRPHIADDIA